MKFSNLLSSAVGLACAVLFGAGTLHAETSGVRAVYQAKGVASTPDDVAWNSITGSDVALLAQSIIPPIGGGSIKSLQVKAMHDGQWLAIRFEWQDASADRAVGVDAYRDAVAVGFPKQASSTPPSRATRPRSMYEFAS